MKCGRSVASVGSRKIESQVMSLAKVACPLSASPAILACETFAAVRIDLANLVALVCRRSLDGRTLVRVNHSSSAHTILCGEDHTPTGSSKRLASRRRGPYSVAPAL